MKDIERTHDLWRAANCCLNERVTSRTGIVREVYVHVFFDELGPELTEFTAPFDPSNFIVLQEDLDMRVRTDMIRSACDNPMQVRLWKHDAKWISGKVSRDDWVFK